MAKWLKITIIGDKGHRTNSLVRDDAICEIIPANIPGELKGPGGRPMPVEGCVINVMGCQHLITDSMKTLLFLMGCQHETSNDPSPRVSSRSGGKASLSVGD